MFICFPYDLSFVAAYVWVWRLGGVGEWLGGGDWGGGGGVRIAL